MARLKYYNTKTNAWETVDSTFGTGDVKSVNGVEPDANGNIEIGIPEMPEINYPVTSVNGMTGDVVIEVGSEQVQSNLSQNDPEAPDYVKGRTHYEENNQTVIEWDGSTEGRDMFIAGEDEYALRFYKISDLTPTKEELVGATMTANGETNTIPEELVNEYIEGSHAWVSGLLVVFYAKDIINTDGIAISAPSTGLYINAELSSVSLTYGSTVVHQLDEKWIPDSIARKTDVTWENLPDKPFGDNQTVIEWNNSTDTTGSDSFEYGSSIFAKISDIAPGVSELDSAIISMTADGNTQSFVAKDAYGDSSNWWLVQNKVIDFGGMVLIVHDTDIEEGVTETAIPSTGTYFNLNMLNQFNAERLLLTYGSTKTIEPKFLPKLTAIADLTEAPTAEDFNALLAALRSAGYLATE